MENPIYNHKQKYKMAEFINKIKEKIKETTWKNELKNLYEEFVKSDQAKKSFQAELRNIFKSTGFDKQKFISKLLADKWSRAIFQFDQKEKWLYNKELDAVAGEKSQTKKLAGEAFDKIWSEMLSGKYWVEKALENKEYIVLSKSLKARLINMWISSKQTLDQMWAKDKVILQTELSISDKYWTEDRDVSVRLSLINPKDIALINKEIRENIPYPTIQMAQNYLNAKTWGKYILCHDCNNVNQYNDKDYKFDTDDNDDISAEWLKKRNNNWSVFTQKSLREFVDKMNSKYKNQISDSKNILLWTNYFWFGNNSNNKEMVEIRAVNKNSDKYEKLIKLDISSFVSVPETDSFAAM